MFPLRDNIPTERFPVVTVAIIVLNVIAYFFWQKGGITLGDPSSPHYLHNLIDYGAIPYEITHPGDHCELLSGGAIACEGQAGVQVLTVGQYLRPSERHLPVVRYWHPDEFKALERAAYDLGFEHIAAGPLVRSSYHADEHVKQQLAGTGPLAAAAG